jgi:5'-3' exoribonuclease 2
MGVPALFRWLSAKYPKIVGNVAEASSEETPLDLLTANPNGCEFDSLYLDMNGIIHPCCHPMDKVF